jgi:phosphatidate phosphatase
MHRATKVTLVIEMLSADSIKSETYLMVTAKEVFIDFHLLDFIFLVGLALVWMLLQNANPNHLYVPKRDPRCSYPHYDSGIREFTNLTFMLAVPSIVYFILYLILKIVGVMNGMVPFDFLYVIVGHFGCILMANILSNIIKLQVGRPRPDFFDVLGPNANCETPQPEELSPKEYIECFKSFPSGHTVTASAGVMFFVLFLQHAIASDQLTVFFLKVVPFCWTFYVGAMRITEHRHHIEDVLAGMIIGFLFPIVFFHGQESRLFPPEVKP